MPEKYSSEFELQYGKIAYLGTNEDRLSVLANSQYLRSYIASGDFLLANYIAPVDGGTITSNVATGYYEISDWVVDIYNTSGAIMYGTIVGYNGTTTNYTILNIPDTFNCSLGGESKIVKITGIEGDGTNNILSEENPNTSHNVTVQKVMVAKNIKKITNKGLANLGNNIQCHILYIGNDLILGNDKSTNNVTGMEGIENTCGSFTFVAPNAGNYTFKLWGASGADGYGEYNKSNASINGLGGYSQGTVALNAGDVIYCYIGGKGLFGTSILEDGSGGYNGGGSGLRSNGYYGYAGGGATDIRFGGSQVTQSGEDYRILVAGGGGGADNAGGGKNGSDDGSGGCGGGTVSTAKSSWSGTIGIIDGKTSVYARIEGFKGTANFDLYYYNTITQNEDDEDQILAIACPGGWNSDDTPKGALYSADSRDVMKFFGQNATKKGTVSGVFNDHAGGGAGYYGGECSCHNNGGGAGGSAYADFTGVVKQVTNIRGYCGYENGDGAEMLGKWGNGKIIISQ